MSLESDVLSALQSSNDVTAILTHSPPQIYAAPVPQNETLFVTVSVVGSAPQNQIDGDTALDRARIQIDSFAETYEESISLGVAVRKAMRNASFTSYPLNQVNVYEDQTRIYRVIQDFAVWHDPN